MNNEIEHWEMSENDFLYHLGMGTDTHDLKAMFGDVKFVCMGGSAKRMKHFANLLADQFGIVVDTDGLKDLSGHADRYSMYKIGPVIAVNHGIGMASMLVMLHEVIKLVRHAQCEDVTFIRIGTSGGIGVEPGTVVLTDSAVDECLNNFVDMNILGKKVRRFPKFNKELIDEVKNVAKDHFQFPVVSGKTMSSNDFYEGQGRLDGAICSYSMEDKMNYLRNLADAGVVNIEMEALLMGAILYKCHLKSLVVCVTLLDRLKGDQVTIASKVKQEYEARPQLLCAAYIKSKVINKQVL